MKLPKSIRSIIPRFLLNKYREHKRTKFNKNLSQAHLSGSLISCGQLKSQLESMGIKEGDSLLVHASLRQMGFIQDGPATVNEALLSVLGADGNLLMPSSPVVSLQVDYVQDNPIFNVKHTPSRMGAISEHFRTMKGVKRSLHPTEPVCAHGPQAAFLTEGHFNQLTPYSNDSPFHRLCELKGKILYIGVSLDNAGTSLHLLEDAVEFAYPVYCDEIYDLRVIDDQNVEHRVKTKVHNPIYSKKRRCDDLIPLFLTKNACKQVTLGNASCLLFDANLMLNTMKEAYELNGTTMYTPNGLVT
jgi:aminoglycoside 3-N-acetyltransferase